jgi:hypothetical protein
VLGGIPGATGGGNGGGVVITAQDANTTGTAGSVNITSGASPSGTAGTINLRTTDGAVSMRTTSGFSGSEQENLTFGSQQTTGAGNSFSMVVVGTLDTDGQNLKVSVNASGVNAGDDADVVSGYIVQSFYRAAGVVRSIGVPHVDDQQDEGAWPSSTTPSFGLVINGDDIELHFEWTGILTAAFTVNLSAHWTRQEGGFAS